MADADADADAAAAASSPAPAVKEEATSRQAVEAATTDDNPKPATTAEPSTSGGDVVLPKGKQKHERDADDGMVKCQGKRPRIDEPALSGLLARRAGFVRHLKKIRIPASKHTHFCDSDCESA